MENGTFISQTKYCLWLLTKYDMKNSKTILTFMASNILIEKYENRVERDIIKYRGILGSLLYFIANRLNSMLSVCMWA